ncbi:MAG: hypothetical protein FJ128_13715 [Deltaproteobacteria bacterium]|nr:hypothetical protein [Deltaproteobacteria bacterium]
MPNARKGLTDIRTHSGTVKDTVLPHKAHLRLCHIEMEIIRRNKEKKAAQQRIADIEARIQEIAAEKKLLLKVVEEKGDVSPQPQPGPRRSTGGFKIRY